LTGWKEKRLAEIVTKMEEEGFWDNAEAGQVLMKEKTGLEATVNIWKALVKSLEDLQVMAELTTEEGGEALLPEIDDSIKKLYHAVDSAELELMLSGPNDKNIAIITVHPGAGGTESQDWAEMLLRMYLRWAERRGYQTEILDLLPGDEAGIKSVTFEVNGLNAYGI
jgi:peptide chain release factor 2